MGQKPVKAAAVRTKDEPQKIRLFFEKNKVAEPNVAPTKELQGSPQVIVGGGKVWDELIVYLTNVTVCVYCFL